MTGGAGFIGSNLVKRLSTNDSYSVSALIRKESNASQIQKAKVSIIKCDILDIERLREATRDVDVVIHLAAVKEHYKDKNIISSTNIQGTRHLLECSRHVKQFIFASSTLAANPLDAYSVSKKQCEEIIKASGINFTILRIGPVFGSGDTTNLTRLIELIENGKAIPIPGDGKQLIQPTHVDDVVKAIESAIMNGELFARICVVAGKPVSLKEFIDSVSRVLKKNTRRIMIPTRILRPMVRVYQEMSNTPKITVEQLDNLGKTSAYDVVNSDFPISQLESSIEKTAKMNPC